MRKILGVVAGALLTAAALPVLAHHSFAAEFDANKPVKLEGVVTKMEWINPHSWIHIDVKTPSGETQQWMIEGGAPNALLRRGWNRNSLPTGSKITVQGLPGEGRLVPRQWPRYHVRGRHEAVRRLVGHRRAGRTARVSPSTVHRQRKRPRLVTSRGLSFLRVAADSRRPRRKPQFVAKQ